MQENKQKIYEITSQSGNGAYGVVELVVNAETDIKDLPISFTPGSTCLVIATSNVYILNMNKEWKKL